MEDFQILLRELVDAADRTRLCTWLCISDEELAPVLVEARAEAQVVADATNLIRWCLQQDPGRRPTVAEILRHRLLCAPEAAVNLRRRSFN